MNPPLTRRDAVVDTLHGVAVADPYRWLEGGDEPEVRRWVDAQNQVARTALDAIPSRQRWHELLVALMGLPIVQGVELRAGRVVTLERPAGAEQARLVARPFAAPDAEPVVLADPSAGTHDAAAAVDWFATSPDGARVAFGVSEGGTESSVLRVASTADGTLLADEIPNCRACSVAWEPDGSGFFYTRYPEGDEYHRTVHHHRLGAPWPDDPVVWADHPTPQTWPNVVASPGGRFLLVEAMVGWSRTDLHLLDRTTGRWHTLLAGVDAASSFTFATDTALLGVTMLGAPRGRIVRIDAEAPAGPDGWHTVVPERDVVVGAPVVAGDGFYLAVTDDAVDRLEHWAFDGAAVTEAAGSEVAGSEVAVTEVAGTEVAGTGVCSVAGLAADRDTGDALALLDRFDRPPTLLRIDGAAVHDHAPAAAPAGVADLDVTRAEYASADGTMVGILLVHRADVVPGPGTPAILTGYGGFAISETPAWSPMVAAWCDPGWCEAGGLYAIACLRGGFEHGEAWHQAGRREHKQNVFDDFLAAADWLVATGRTSRERLAIAGGSNGGLLVGAVLTQRPDVSRAAWCAVPLLDMVRFPGFLIARLWTDEYGDPDVAEEFGWLYAYSPYHRVRDGERYPAVLLTTAEGDTRVDPMHARKMAARLQAATAGGDEGRPERPVLLVQEGRAGHGAGKPVGKRAAELADVLAFFTWQLAG